MSVEEHQPASGVRDITAKKTKYLLISYHQSSLTSNVTIVGSCQIGKCLQIAIGGEVAPSHREICFRRVFELSIEHLRQIIGPSRIERVIVTQFSRVVPNDFQ